MHTLPRPPFSPHEFVPPNYFKRLRPNQLNPKDQPLEIDLGCGDGSFLVALAEHRPDHQFIGVERLLGRCKKVARKIRRADLTNTQILRLDSKYLVEWLLPAESVWRIHLLCPDPWPKVRHHRRRIIQAPFLKALASSLSLGGEFLFMTDHEEYFESAKQTIESTGIFSIAEWTEDSFYYPKTDFQNQWETEGKVMHRLRCQKVDQLPPLTALESQILESVTRIL